MSSKLRILVANHALDMWGGSETHTYAVVEELVRRGHDVELFTPHPGRVSERLKAVCGVKVVLEIGSDGDYDLQLISHSSCVWALQYAQGFKVQTCHGTIHRVEQPAQGQGVDRYVAISEEVRAHLTKLGLAATTIRNGVNCERFQSKRPIRKRPERVLALVQSAEAQLFVAEACGLAELELKVRNKFDDGGVFRIEDDMVEADIVVSLGRGAYEAMACGRNVYVFDARRYQGPLADGMLTADSVDELLKFNCSGRRFRRPLTPRVMADELVMGYRAQRGQWLRAYAYEHLNIRTQVDKYLALYREAE